MFCNTCFTSDIFSDLYLNVKYYFIIICDDVFQPETSDVDYPQVLVWCMQRYYHALIHNMYSMLLKAELKYQTLYLYT